MNSDDADLIEERAEQIAGQAWTKRRTPRDLSLVEQLYLFVQHPDMRGPSEGDEVAFEQLMGLASEAEQLEGVPDARMEF